MRAQVTQEAFFNVLWRNMDSGMYRNVSDMRNNPNATQKKKTPFNIPYHPASSDFVQPRCFLFVFFFFYSDIFLLS